MTDLSSTPAEPSPGPTVTEAFPELARPIAFPIGHTDGSLLEYLHGFRLDGGAAGELDGYLREDFRRFVYTLQMTPPAPPRGRLLEIGANPYFTSVLLRKFTSYELSFTNYFGVSGGFSSQAMRHAATGEVLEFPFANCNIDAEELPFPGQFDTILFCEVVEHTLINGPVDALLRIKRALRDDGTLILTTPNVARLENVARFIAGANIYDPFSGYGIYGRHNREYSRHELYLLLTQCGFDIEEMFTSDVHANHSAQYCPPGVLSTVVRQVQHREFDLGQYLFVRARNRRPAQAGKPRWLYRSYPESEFCDSPR